MRCWNKIIFLGDEVLLPFLCFINSRSIRGPVGLEYLAAINQLHVEQKVYKLSGSYFINFITQ